MLKQRTLLSPAASPPMDPGIWSRLPQELLEHVLSLLPLKSFLNLRSTCKRFKYLLFSPTFISKHSSLSPFSSFLLLSHPQFHPRYSLYNTAISAWRDSSLSPSPLLSSNCTGTLLCSSNGLFCFSRPNSSLVICNLLARSSRVVELPILGSFEMLTLASFSSSSFSGSGYKLFFLSSSPCSSNDAFLYDSRTHSWQQFEGFDPILVGNYNQEGVNYKGRLYFATPEPFSVVKFDLETGEWNISEVNLPEELTFVRFVSDGDGTLFLCGGIGRNGISRSMKLWELNEERKEWVEVETVPELMCRKFVHVCYHNYEHVYCFWHEGMICVCCFTWPEILYFKVARRTWHWLPKSPSLPEKWSCGFRWFSFVPHLYASV